MIHLKIPDQFALKCSSSKTLDKTVTHTYISKKNNNQKCLQGKDWQKGMDRHYQKQDWFLNKM